MNKMFDVKFIFLCTGLENFENSVRFQKLLVK